ncbi:amidase [Desertibaculum subflavum]|uniref:amidase n=1 Tax=Desertibaculum subflavum TaxID=2268458 RepID=UPI000E66AE9E
MEELVRLTAREAVHRLATRQVSPLDLIDAAERRINETDGVLNAVPTRCFDRARAHARRLLAEGPPSDPPPGYLYGLPIAVKDLVDVEGVRTTRGSRIFKDNISAHSDISVRNLEQRGAIVIGKSNTPEFGAGAQTFNEVLGTTTNPWDTRKTCAGSSGGAAVALAAGQVWLATGSDLGGSLRTPASFCSVVGLRPSPGRVAHGPNVTPFDTMSVDGPMGRNVADTALFLDAMAGQFPEDPISQPAPAVPFLDAALRPTAPKRVAWTDFSRFGPIAPEVREICAKAARRFESLGVDVAEDSIDFGDPEEMFRVIRASSFLARQRANYETHRELMKPEVQWNVEEGLRVQVDDIARAERARGELYQRASAFFRKYDILALPAAPIPPFDHSIRYPETVEGVTMPTYISWVRVTFAVTLTSLPAISIPCGFTKDGLPVGLQLVGPPRGEARLLSAAAMLEAALGLKDATPIDPRVT